MGDKVTKIGILGGGQLALMMLPTIKSFGFESVILDSPGCSCEELADHFIPGDFKNPQDVLKLSHCDYVTFEIESISLEGYKNLSQKTKVHPSPVVLEMAQDKGKQKEFFQTHKIPSSDFEIKILKGSEDFDGKVVKLCQGGYDGNGVWVSGKERTLPENFINQSCVIENKVKLDKEFSLVCCRSAQGKTEYYEVVEMVMDPELNLLDYQINPSSISEENSLKAREYGQKILNEINYVGVLAIEFFLTENGEIMVNEIAPRVHNSGHNTIESAPTSQFENHLLAISEQELGPVLPAKPSLTMNLIGEGERGKTDIYNGINDPNIFVHLYNKKESRPGRKMGHLTILGSLEELKTKKDQIKSKIKITGRSL